MARPARLRDVSQAPQHEVDPDLLKRLRGALKPGGQAIHEAAEDVPAIWGDDQKRVWWAEDESAIITSPTGTGKTTVAGLVTEARMGFTDNVFGLPVRQGKKKVLYLAMDRPAQIKRALRRQLGEYTDRQLDKRLAFWEGPPVSQFMDNADLLYTYAVAADADTIVVDSLKDAVVKLTDEVQAHWWNRNVQVCNANGVQVLVLHHQRKAGNGEKATKPKELADVYGSTWLTSGVGSVIVLWKNRPGEIEMSMVKAPAGEQDPIMLDLDVHAGTFTMPKSDKEKLAFFMNPHTSKEYAQFLAGDAEIKRGDVAKAQREIDHLVGREDLERAPGTKRQAGAGRPAATYQVAPL